MTYEGVANELVMRIVALIPNNPSILEIDYPWKLFSVPGFTVMDLDPTLAQAQWALSAAKNIYAEEAGGK